VFVGVGLPLSVEDLSPLPPGPDDVVVQIDASGCATPTRPSWAVSLPWTAPSILGHEVTGIAVEIGSMVTRVRVVGSGDQLRDPRVLELLVLRAGQSHLCEHTFAFSETPRARRHDGTAVPAFSSLGGFADQMTVPEILDRGGAHRSAPPSSSRSSDVRSQPVWARR